MPDRAAEINAFLERAGWGDAKRATVPGDASTRRYEVLTLSGKSAILMDAPASAESAAAPLEATPEEREALGYNAIARLAGPHLEAFTGIAQALTRRGFSAPHIYAADPEAGLALMENLGTNSYAKVLQDHPEKEAELYRAAIGCLAEIYRCVFSNMQESFGKLWGVGGYDETALLAETRLLTEWYLPYRALELSSEQSAQLDQAWREVFTPLFKIAPTLALRDFHAENLFWLPERDGTARVGLIDFQDALFGHPAYDVVSLLEDARRDVDPQLVAPLLDRFCDKALIRDKDAFRAAFAVLGAQRNAKILGIFVRLAQRDGKEKYLSLLPRVEAHFKANLSHPALTKIAKILRPIL